MSDNLSKEILLLKERVSEKPQSSLFLPLAEAYLKCDQTDEAAAVLVTGIQSHPHSVSGHSMLGRIYLQKGQFHEAKTEFEHVLEVNPEHISALKKMVTIFQKEDNRLDAFAAATKILSIDPYDAEGKQLLSSLENEASSAPSSDVADVAMIAPPVQETPPRFSEAPTSPPMPQEGHPTELSPRPLFPVMERLVETAEPLHAPPEGDQTIPAISLQEEEVPAHADEVDVGLHEERPEEDAPIPFMRDPVPDSEVTLPDLQEDVFQPMTFPILSGVEPVLVAAAPPHPHREQIERLESWLVTIQSDLASR